MSGDSAVTVPNFVIVPAYQTTASFNATVNSVKTARTVTLTANAGNVSNHVELGLSAALSTMAIGSSSVDFGEVFLQIPTTRSITVKSTGAAALTVSSVTLQGAAFAVLPPTLPATLNPGQTMVLPVQFTPGAVGPATGNLAITSNSSAGGLTTIPLSGSGVPPSSFANVSILTTPGRAISPTFMGLSHEWDNGQIIVGDSAVGVDLIYRQLLKNLTAYGSGPINLRIGGNSTDLTGEPTAATAQPFAELAAALGTHFSLGVNLGSNNVNLAVDQVRAYASQMPAGSLDAIEIGNEPDLYAFKAIRPTPYRYQDYQLDFDYWKTNILPLLPAGTKLMGPSWASPSSLSNAASYDSLEAGALATISQHFYVADGKGVNPDDILLTPSAAYLGARTVSAAVVTAHQNGIPFRMGEMNSLWNGGEAGISNAFGSALWSIDAMFQYASVGVDGVNLHTGEDAVYAPFSIRARQLGSGTAYSLNTVNPLYYGLLFFQAMTGNNAHLLPVHVTTAANMTCWSTIDAAGTPRLAIINKDKNQTGTVNVAISGFSHAQVYRLTAPSYKATSGVTFAGQTFDGSADGTIQGLQVTDSVTLVDGVFNIPMPITSAAMVVFSK